MYMFAYPKKLIHAGTNEGSPETKGGANDVVIQLMKTNLKVQSNRGCSFWVSLSGTHFLHAINISIIIAL